MNFTPKDLRRGKREMEKSLSAAQKVMRRFSAGPPRRSDMQRSAIAAVAEALMYRDEVETAMRELGLSPKEDLAIGIIFLADGKPPEMVVSVLDFGQEAVRVLRSTNAKVMGILFSLVDREKGEYRIWARRYVADKTLLGDLQELSKNMRGQA